MTSGSTNGDMAHRFAQWCAVPNADGPSKLAPDGCSRRQPGQPEPLAVALGRPGAEGRVELTRDANLAILMDPGTRRELAKITKAASFQAALP